MNVLLDSEGGILGNWTRLCIHVIFRGHHFLPQTVQKSGLEYVFLMVGKEVNLYRHLEQPFLKSLGNAFVVKDPLAVFFGSRDNSCRERFHCAHYPGNVHVPVLVMVGKAEMLYDFVRVTEESSQRSVFGYAREKDQLL